MIPCECWFWFEYLSFAMAFFGCCMLAGLMLCMQRQLAAKNPFLVYVASHAPHLPSTPAPWYLGMVSCLFWILIAFRPS